MSPASSTPAHRRASRRVGLRTTTPRGVRLYRLAWLSLLLFPLSFVAAFLVGEGLAGLLGVTEYPVAPPPVWAALAVGVPAILVFSVPAAFAALLAWRAQRWGTPWPWTPAIVAGVVVVGFCGQNLLSYVAQVLFG